MYFKIFKNLFYISSLVLFIGFDNDISANDLTHYDILITNGRVVDGTGNPWFFADIALKDERIVKIGNLSKENAERIIDADGLVVAPGFIDPHTHALRGIFDVPGAESALLQGVTTLTEGNDGASPFPIDHHFKAISDKKISPNWGTFVGHGTLRQMVMGAEDRKPTRSEITQMKKLIREAMEDGALGMSTGLFYVPGSYASSEEIIELSKVVAEYGGCLLYTSPSPRDS